MKVGLTGGIGAGKSTVADMFSKLGAVVIRSDELARQVIEPNTPGFQKVLSRFGNQILQENGSIDRQKLAQIVFNDQNSLKDLEEIIHPLVRNKTNELIESQTQETIVVNEVSQTQETIVVNEVPLLLEKKMEKMFDFLVVVISSEKNRINRLQKRGISEPEAKKRMSLQVSDEARKSSADFLITNDGNIEQLEADVAKVWQALLERKFKS
ncbi:MAG: dephospho-CoA kinase [Actinobacteria bacterium]|nr:dephospho-CoA kinase [Actinomycetota bacterium]